MCQQAEGSDEGVKAAGQLDADTREALIEKAQQDCQKQQDAYDTRTGHGAKQGVVLKRDA